MHKVVERRVLKFIGVGLSAALVDYVVYTFAHMVKHMSIKKNSEKF